MSIQVINSVIAPFGSGTKLSSTSLLNPLSWRGGLYRISTYLEISKSVSSATTTLQLAWTDHVGTQTRDIASIDWSATDYVEDVTIVNAVEVTGITVQMNGDDLPEDARFGLYMYVERLDIPGWNE